MSSPASPTCYKKKKIFCFFKFWNFFVFLFFYRMCAERAQEHTHTHTALTAGVEGRKKPGNCYIYTSGGVIERDQWSCGAFEKEVNKGAVTTKCTHDDEILKNVSLRDGIFLYYWKQYSFPLLLLNRNLFEPFCIAAVMLHMPSMSNGNICSQLHLSLTRHYCPDRLINNTFC